MSGENPMHPAQTEATHENLVRHLKELGLQHQDITGKYENEERGAFIHGPTREQMIALGNKFGQDSIIHSNSGRHELIYTNGPNIGKSRLVTPGADPAEYHESKPEDFFSHLPGLGYFHINFDFNKDPQHQGIVKDEMNPNVHSYDMSTPAPLPAPASAPHSPRLKAALASGQPQHAVALPNGMLEHIHPGLVRAMHHAKRPVYLVHPPVAKAWPKDAAENQANRAGFLNHPVTMDEALESGAFKDRTEHTVSGGANPAGPLDAEEFPRTTEGEREAQRYNGLASRNPATPDRKAIQRPFFGADLPTDAVIPSPANLHHEQAYWQDTEAQAEGKSLAALRYRAARKAKLATPMAKAEVNPQQLLTPFGTAGAPSQAQEYNYNGKLFEAEQLAKKHGFKTFLHSGRYGAADPTKNYDAGFLPIEDPGASSAKAESDARTYHTLHQLARALTQPEIRKIYGESSGPERDVHWADLASQKHRELNSKIGIHVPDESFNRERNRVLAHALHTSMTGQSPDLSGFSPHSHHVPLSVALDYVRDLSSAQPIKKSDAIILSQQENYVTDKTTDHKSALERIKSLAAQIHELRKRESDKLAKALIPPHNHNVGQTVGSGVEDVPPSKVKPQGREAHLVGGTAVMGKGEMCKACGSSPCKCAMKAELVDSKGKHTSNGVNPKSVMPDDKPCKEVSASGSGGQIKSVGAIRKAAMEMSKSYIPSHTKYGATKPVTGNEPAPKPVSAEDHEADKKAAGIKKEELLSKPSVSEAQRRAMGAAASGNSTLGIPKKVGKEFIDADKGGKLPEHKKNELEKAYIPSHTKYGSTKPVTGNEPAPKPVSAADHEADKKAAGLTKGALVWSHEGGNHTAVSHHQKAVYDIEHKDGKHHLSLLSYGGSAGPKHLSTHSTHEEAKAAAAKHHEGLKKDELEKAYIPSHTKHGATKPVTGPAPAPKPVTPEEHEADKKAAGIKKASMPPMAKPPSGVNMSTKVPASAASKPAMGASKPPATPPMVKGVMSDIAQRESDQMMGAKSGSAPAPKTKLPSPTQNEDRAAMLQGALAGEYQPPTVAAKTPVPAARAAVATNLPMTHNSPPGYKGPYEDNGFSTGYENEPWWKDAEAKYSSALNEDLKNYKKRPGIFGRLDAKNK
jgi:hypothetical protein